MNATETVAAADTSETGDAWHITAEAPLLIVHGDAAVRETIAAVLKVGGYRTICLDHRAALAGLQDVAPAAVLLDVHGPAREVAAALARRHGDVPIVALSTRPGALDGSDLGAVALLPLPFALDELLGCVARLSHRSLGGTP